MKFAAPYELFKNAVFLVNSVQTGTSLMTLCKHILIEADKETQTVTLSKTDLESKHTATIKATVEEGGRATSEGDNLAKALKTYESIKKSENFDVVAHLEEPNRISYRFTDNKRHKPLIMTSEDTDIFPEIDPFGTEEASCQILADHLVDYVEKSLLAIKKHDSKRECSGAYLIMTGPSVEIAATNRMEMSSIRATVLDVSYSGSDKNAFTLIPRKTLEAISKTVKGSESVSVSFSDAQVEIKGVFEGANYSIRNATVSLPSPISSADIIPQNARTVVKLPVAALKNTLTYIDAIMDRNLTNKINIVFNSTEPDSVTLSCKTAKGEIPGISIEAKAEQFPEGTSLLILPDKKLANLLKATKSQEIKISFTETGSPSIFQGSDEDYFTFVIQSLKSTGDDEPVAATAPTKKADPVDIETENIEGFEDIMLDDFDIDAVGDEVEI